MTVTWFPKNTVFGPPLPPNTFLPATAFEVDPDPGWFAPLLLRKERPMNSRLYPVTVFSSRYGGTYEGAPWIAVQAHADPSWGPYADFGEADLDGCQSGDLECMEWFSRADFPVGRGDTPDLAVVDLARQLDIPWTPGEDSLHKRFEKALEEAEKEKNTE